MLCRRTVNTLQCAPRRWWIVGVFLLLAAAFLATFFAGMHVHQSRSFPFPQLRAAYKTLVVNLGGLDTGGLDVGSAQCAPVRESLRYMLGVDLRMPELKCPAAGVAGGDAAAARVRFFADDQLADPVLVKGEVGTFLDYCPGPWGCLAVGYSRSGSVSHAWPFRPQEIGEANIASESDYPYEHPAGWRFSHDIAWYNLSPYPSGDLLVVLQFQSSHPAAGGVARVGPDGKPRWYRKDYSHHWPHVVGDHLALVPSERLRRTRIVFEIGGGQRGNPMELECDQGMIREDQVNAVNGIGDVLQEVPMLDAIIASRHAGSLVGADPCDPVHLNFVHVLGEDAGGAPGIAPGDWVVSLRNLSAFGVLDKTDQRLKRLVRGSFHWQHGVRHLGQARFLLFDNLGTDGVHGPSRLLMVDLATGEETTVFPTDATPAHLRDWFAMQRGQFDVSADRRRALLADPAGGRAVEIRLSDANVLNVFRQVHDLSSLTGFPDELTKNAWLFHFHGIHYANRGQAKR